MERSINHNLRQLSKNLMKLHQTMGIVFFRNMWQILAFRTLRVLRRYSSPWKTSRYRLKSVATMRPKYSVKWRAAL